MTHQVFQPPQQRRRSQSWTTAAAAHWSPEPSCHEARTEGGVGSLQQVREASANGFHEP